MTMRYAHIEPVTMRAAMTQLPALAEPASLELNAKPLAKTGTQ